MMVEKKRKGVQAKKMAPSRRSFLLDMYEGKAVPAQRCCKEISAVEGNQILGAGVRFS